MKKLTVDVVRVIVDDYSNEYGDNHEPIPAFHTCDIGRLESSLETPFQTYDGKYLYRGTIRKAAVLFYGLIKNHPFQNGNKRIAVLCLLVFLKLNKDKWLNLEPMALYKIPLLVASSDPSERDGTLQLLESVIKVNLIN